MVASTDEGPPKDVLKWPKFRVPELGQVDSAGDVVDNRFWALGDGIKLSKSTAGAQARQAAGGYATLLAAWRRGAQPATNTPLDNPCPLGFQLSTFSRADSTDPDPQDFGTHKFRPCSGEQSFVTCTLLVPTHL